MDNFKILNSRKLTVICGPMFAGKTQELLRLLDRYHWAKIKVVVFKPKIDTRNSPNSIKSRSGASREAINISHSSEIINMIRKISISSTPPVIAFDEVQFFDEGIITVIFQLLNNGHHVIVSGLDKDAFGNPFMNVARLLVYADEIIKLKAVCRICGADAQYTKRNVKSDQVILIGDSDEYQSVCFKCFDWSKYRKY